MDSKYTPTIGLEIHAELNTLTKMFCSCKNDPDETSPNVNICPVCLAHPGTLPVINKEAVKNIVKVGVAVNGRVASLTEFDRKNYFYPDIPKGYQISQYKNPIVAGGELAGVAITRVHLEEDTGTLVHEGRGTMNDELSNLDAQNSSLVNFNRAGVPLMELVTEPVIHSSADASKFAKELQLLLQYLGVAEANMEKGEMRVEANVSVSLDDKFGTKVEVKNLNSFKAAERAIEYEIKRQGELLERGGKVAQETRGWDEAKQITFSQRQKEESHDYRYFPDPDLPKLDLAKIQELNVDEIKKGMPETPEGKRIRYKESFGLKDSDIEFYIGNRGLSNFFEMAAGGKIELSKTALQLLSNYVVSDLASRGDEASKFIPEHFAELARMISENKISSRGAKDIIALLAGSEKSPEEIAIEKDLLQKSDEGEIEKIVDDIISANQNIVDEYKKGKLSALQFLVGQGMKLSKGSANPQVLKKVFERKLAK
jgi:aspartyl-tRNA(Asn)/glutamyl-tRNA(Gln) amidotransferase subunit B